MRARFTTLVACAPLEAARLLRALLTVDFAYFRHLREAIGGPRIFRLALCCVLITYAALGIRAIHKKEGAIFRSHLLGSRFRAVVSNRGQCERDLALTRSNTRSGRPTASETKHRFNIYEPEGLHRPYPPSFAMIFAPISCIPLRLARAGWFLMQLALLLLCAWIADQLASEWFPSWPRNRWVVLGLTLLLGTRFIQREVSGGQVNLVALTLCLLTVWLLHRGAGYRAGIPLGLALAIKLTPLLLAAYLLYRRHWRQALTALLVGAAVLALPRVFLGPTLYQENMAYWVAGLRSMNHPDLFENRYSVMIVPFSWGNQSLRYAVFRYVSTYPRTRTDRPRWGYADFANFSPAQAQRVIKWAYGLLLLGVLLLAGWRAPDPRTMPFLIECAIVFTLMLALSPITWKAHFVYLTPGLFLLTAYGCCQRSRAPWRYLMLFFLACVAMNRTTLGRIGEDLHQAYYVNTFGMLLVLAGLCHLLRLARRTHFGIVGTPPADL